MTTITIPTIDQVELDVKTVFYRADYNVPIEGGVISDTTRIEETLPTLRLMRERGARIVIGSHMGRPKGKRNEKYSLAPVQAKLAELSGVDVQFAEDCVGEAVRTKIDQLAPGAILLLENLRYHEGEEKNDTDFAEQLKASTTIYINDAFGASHRAHASIVALPRLYPLQHRAGGLLLAKELQFLQKVTNVEERPFVAILGGAKIAGKIEPLEVLVRQADTVLIGGGMANTFLLAEGKKMGGSLVDLESLDVAKRILSAPDKRARVVLPVDLVVADSLDQPTSVRTVDVGEGLGENDRAFDIGEKTIELFNSEMAEAKTLFWNGPMGVFEKEQFARGTREIAKGFAQSSAISIVGGGESVDAVKSSGFAAGISHISTGGGAALELISGMELPGVEVLREGISS